MCIVSAPGASSRGSVARPPTKRRVAQLREPFIRIAVSDSLRAAPPAVSAAACAEMTQQQEVYS